MTSPGKCGTYAGYQAHRKAGHQPCDACTEANRAYAADRRKRPGVRDEENRQHYARDRALARLAKEYPRRYQQLVTEETLMDLIDTPEGTAKP